MTVSRAHINQALGGNFHPVYGKKFAEALEEYDSKFVESEPRDSIRAMQFLLMLIAANKLDPGDYVELGTHHGLTLKLIYSFMDPDYMLYSFDTFEGFDERDLEGESKKSDIKRSPGGFEPTNPEKIMYYLNYPPNLRIVKGWVPDSLEAVKDKSWRFAHIDMDLYPPTLAALEWLWPNMVPGGVIMMHDYCHPNFGARHAMNEFCAAKGIFPVVLPDYWGTAVIRKGAT